MCGGEFYQSYDFTEYICDFCSGRDEDGTDHEFCDEFVEEACACRNTDHKLLSPQEMYEQLMKPYMDKAKEKLNV